ncbi:protein diaphanous [Clonorchis sinensis]|uniref:Protein diaphanous n=1 Tax=Clonorchis sinensis TaxID=79923 RepID=G7YSD7_CLOSI|nr:protein diaphanous [Clonorchis sinensis]
MLDRINTRLRESFRDSTSKSIFVVLPKAHTQRSDKQTVLQDGSEKPSLIKAEHTRFERQTRSFTGSHHSGCSFALGSTTTPKSLDHRMTTRSGPDFGKAISDRMSRLTRSLRIKTGQPGRSDELHSQPRPSKMESLHCTANGDLRGKPKNGVPRKSGLLSAPSVLFTRRVKTADRAVQTGESTEELSKLTNEHQRSPSSTTLVPYSSGGEAVAGVFSGQLQAAAESGKQETPICSGTFGSSDKFAGHKESDITPMRFKVPPPRPVVSIPPPPPLLFDGMNATQLPVPESPMPYNMKPKKTFSAPYRLKKVCVTPLSKTKLNKESVWVKIEEGELLSDTFVRKLHRRFRIKENTRMKNGGAVSEVTSIVTSTNLCKQLEGVQLTAGLDENTSITQRFHRIGSKRFGLKRHSLELFSTKVAQTLAIAMASIHREPSEIADDIINLRTSTNSCKADNTLEANTGREDLYDSKFPEMLLDTLIANLPPMDRILKLSDCPTEYNNLIESDQLVYFLAPLRHRLPAHLHAMKMLLQFDSTAEQVKAALHTACDCLAEIRNSISIPRLLSCALALVNALNAAGYEGLSTECATNRRPLVGFQVRNLVRLIDTKDSSNTRSLIDYVVELMEINFGKSVHQWPKELTYLDSAQKLYNAKLVEENLVDIRRDIARLEIDLRGVGGAIDMFDQLGQTNTSFQTDVANALRGNFVFRKRMSLFLDHATHEQGRLNELHQAVSERFSEVATYLALDRSKYTADQLFADLRTFRDMYQRAHLLRGCDSEHRE